MKKQPKEQVGGGTAYLSLAVALQQRREKRQRGHRPRKGLDKNRSCRKDFKRNVLFSGQKLIDFKKSQKKKPNPWSLCKGGQ